MVQETGERSLEAIEGSNWGEPPAEATRVMASVYALRRRPVSGLSTEDLRLLIGQRVGVEVLVPRALDRLEADPLAEGDYYPGDLLEAVLRVPAGYWAGHAGERARLAAVLGRVDAADVDDELRALIDGFAGR